MGKTSILATSDSITTSINTAAIISIAANMIIFITAVVLAMSVVLV